MTNKATQAQCAARSRFSLACARWAALDDDSKLTWKTFATRVSTSAPAELSKRTTGRQLYIKHMTRWLTALPDVAEMLPEAFPPQPPTVTDWALQTGVYNTLTWTFPPATTTGIFFEARSHSSIGWSRLCWHYLTHVTFNPPGLFGINLREFVLPIMGEILTGELVKLRIQWLADGYAITPEPVFFEQAAT